jgi:CcmD family protein
MSGIGYLATGFGLIWLILGCYLCWLGRCQAALGRRLHRLESGREPADDALHDLPHA